ncbi:MAG TPA: hypothetical protein VKW06_07930 [Candidatus Angelobacter sp.]|nr:hypothetical protein [Candidatus Angelobacter sp.]
MIVNVIAKAQVEVLVLAGQEGILRREHYRSPGPETFSPQRTQRKAGSGDRVIAVNAVIADIAVIGKAKPLMTPNRRDRKNLRGLSETPTIE